MGFQLFLLLVFLYSQITIIHDVNILLWAGRNRFSGRPASFSLLHLLSTSRRN